MTSVYPALNSRYALILSGDSPKIYSAYTYREAAHAESSIEYQTMNRSAADVLTLCTGVNSIDDIVTILSEKYGESAEKTRAFVEEFLEECDTLRFISYLNSPVFKDPKIIGDYSTVIPTSATFEITKRCPLHCAHCYNDSGTAKNYEVTLHEALTIIDRLHAAGVQKLAISGGEPFARKDAIEIIEYSAPRFIGIMVGTNGFLLSPNIISRLSALNENYGNIAVQISIDGLEQTHDLIRGMRGSFSRAIQSVQALSEKKVPTIVSMTINKMNYEEMDGVAQLSCELGAHQLSIGITVEQGRARGHNLVPTINSEDFFSRVRGIQEQYSGKGMYVSLDEEVAARYTNGGSIEYCGAGVDLITVRENGDVSPCVAFPFTYGNILKNEPKDIFRPEVANIFKSIPRPTESICGECPSLDLNCRQCNARALDSNRKECEWRLLFEEAKRRLNNAGIVR